MTKFTAVSATLQSPVINRIDIDADTLRLWRHLWRGGGASYFWRAWMEGDKQYSESQWFAVDKIPTTLATKHGDNWYFGVHPTSAKRSKAQRSRNVDIAAINCLFGEFDVKDYSGDWTALRQHVYTLPLSPTCVVISGGGLHCYWLLADTIVIGDDAGRQAVRNLQNRWCDFVGGDKNAKDIARILRIPGTTNYKPDYAPNFPTVQWEHTDWQRLYSLADVAGVLPTQSTSTPTPAPSMPVAGGGDLVQRWVAMDLATLATASNGNRNDQLNRTAFRLGQWIPHELTRSDAERQLLAVAQSIGLSAGEAQRTIRSGLDAGAKSPRQLVRRSAPTPAPADDAGDYDGFGPMPDDELPAMPDDIGDELPAMTVAAKRPEIDVSMQHGKIADAVLLAIIHANDADETRPSVVISNGALAQVVGLDDGDARIDAIDDDVLTHIVAQHADFVSYGKEGDDGLPKRINRAAPTRVIAGVRKSRQWPGLPRLDRLVTSPTFAPDGTLIATPGYSLVTQKWLTATLAIGDTTPTTANVDAAKRLLMDEWLGDFPFTDAASRAHAIALTLQPWAMTWIDGPTPMWTIDAPVAGSGKTLLAQCCAFPFAGMWPSVRTMPDSRGGDELQKMLTSALRERPSAFILDNLTGDIDSDSLAGAITAGTYSGRELGSNRTISGRCDWQWISTSNNQKLSIDLTRRSVLIRLQPLTESPELRTGFKHADLVAWTTAHRAEIVTAALTLIRNWIEAGKPESTATKGSFPSWAHVIGGILDAAGIDGFLTNDDALRSAASPQRDIFRNFVAAWWHKHGDAKVTSSALFAIASYVETVENDDKTDDGRRIIRRTGADMLGALLASEKEAGRRKQLGSVLSGKTGTAWRIPSETIPDGVPAAAVAHHSVVIDSLGVNRENKSEFALRIVAESPATDDAASTYATYAPTYAPSYSSNGDEKVHRCIGCIGSSSPRVEKNSDAIAIDIVADDDTSKMSYTGEAETTYATYAPMQPHSSTEAHRLHRFTATDDAATIVAALLAGETVSYADTKRWNAACDAAKATGYIVKRTVVEPSGHRFVLERIASASTIATELGL